MVEDGVVDALPLSYTGSVEGATSTPSDPIAYRGFQGDIRPPSSFFKAAKLKNTGNPFRSSVLGVMSPARCLCAMPVIKVL